MSPIARRAYVPSPFFSAVCVRQEVLGPGTTLTQRILFRGVLTVPVLIAHPLRAWPTPYGAAFVAEGKVFEQDGTALDPKIGDQIGLVARQVVDFARWRRAGSAI